jgi:hypothetical protein
MIALMSEYDFLKWGLVAFLATLPIDCLALWSFWCRVSTGADTTAFVFVSMCINLNYFNKDS